MPRAQASNEVYTYDNAGRLITVEHGDGKVNTYTLDPAGNRTNEKTEIPGVPGNVSIATAAGSYAESASAKRRTDPFVPPDKRLWRSS